MLSRSPRSTPRSFRGVEARRAKATRVGQSDSDKEDLFELIEREGVKAKREVEERKAEAEAKHLAEREAKAARPIQMASFEL